MLLALDIDSFALIDKLYIEFKKGLNIITGETGAGKSIVVDSINFILGGKFSKEIIKKGKESAKVKAVFEVSKKQEEFLNNLGFECEDGTVEVNRTINSSSKSVCRLNGKIVTLTGLKQISSVLMEIHGQHENQVLFNSVNHIDFLDSFAFKDNNKEKSDFESKFNDFKCFRNKIISDKMDGKTINLRLTTIKEQLKEFDSLKWKNGEEQQLLQKTEAMENAEIISNALNISYSLLYGAEGCVFEQLQETMRALEKIKDINEVYGNLTNEISTIYYELEDVISNIRSEKDSFDFNPERLEEMQKRLFEFSRLKKKYGSSEEEVLTYFKGIKEEIDDLEYKKGHAAELKAQLKELYKDTMSSAKLLSDARKQYGERLEQQVLSHLGDLGMQNARFKVNIDQKELGSKGIDEVEFLFCANKGQDLKPLTKVASGGEISRLMLAFKNVYLDSSINDAMVFDEIDTGISGKMAQAVAVKLANISRNGQVICVTHLPQVAALGDVNIFVSKCDVNEDTKINATRLSMDEKIKEIARLISGSDISESGLMHAQKLIEEGEIIKG